MLGGGAGPRGWRCRGRLENPGQAEPARWRCWRWEVASAGLLIAGKVQKPGGRSESQLRCCLHCCALHSPARFAKRGAGTKLPAVLSWANTPHAATGGALRGGVPENLPASNGRLERSPDVTARNRGGSSPRAPIQKEICGAAFPASHSPAERVSALTAACCSPEAAGPSRSRDPRVKQRSARSSGGRGVGLFCC